MNKERVPRKFEFATDTFAFANELFWEYQPDPRTGKMSSRRREPVPDYAHRCFVLAVSARLFLYHARFEASGQAPQEQACRALIRQVIGGNPRKPSDAEDQTVIPGFANLRLFSASCEKLLKAECGGAWRSYFLRSHWRMVWPISRSHQQRTSDRLRARVESGWSPIVHLVTFPSLTINHGMVIYGAEETREGATFLAYDPNDPTRPAQLKFDGAARTFSLSPNHYWAGGGLNVIEIYHNWLM
jgi:hypothetical protein